MTRLAITALAALALAVPAATAAPVRQEAAPSIAGIAASSPQFSTLLSLVKKAGLAGTLSKPGAYTVFAPTNAAFAKVPKATLNALAKNPAAVEARAPLPRRRWEGHRGKGGQAALGEDARRPDGDHPRHGQDRADQQLEGDQGRCEGLERDRARDRPRAAPARVAAPHLPAAVASWARRRGSLSRVNEHAVEIWSDYI